MHRSPPIQTSATHLGTRNRSLRFPLSCAFAILFIAIAIGIVATFASAASSTGAITLQVVPATAAPEPGRPNEILVVATNTGATTATDLALWWSNNTSAEVSLRQPLPMSSLKGGAETAWTLPVSAPGVLAGGSISFRLNYKLDGVDRIATAPLEITTQPSVKMEDVATVEVKTALETLDQQHPGLVYLFITNKTAVTLTVQRVVPSGPSFVSFEVNDRTRNLPLAVPGAAKAAQNATSESQPLLVKPHQTRAVVATIKADERVRPGKHLLLFDIDLAWQTAAGADTGHVIATQDAQIGILGLSEVMKALSVPLFVLLPGVLMLIAAAIIYALLKPAGAPPVKDIPFFETLSAPFWVVAITLSILMAWVYPHLQGQNYLSEYGLADVIRVWFASVAVGFVAALVAVLLWRRFRRDPAFSADDEAETLIRKMAAKHLTLLRRRFDVDGSAAYALENTDTGKPAWMSPPIVLTEWNRRRISADELRAFLHSNESANELYKRMQRDHIKAAFRKERLEHEGPWVPTDQDVASRQGLESMVSIR